MELELVRDVSRRGLLTGLGVAGGAALLGGAGIAEASAAPARAQSSVHPDTPPGISSISSAPAAGISYRFNSWLDFSPELNFTEGRQWSSGVYTNVTSDYLASTFDIPNGATVHDMEWYTVNSVAATGYAVLWQSGTASLPTLGSFTVPASGGMHASRFVFPSSSNGPLPHGCKLAVSMLTPTDGSVRINGCRVGFVGGPTQTVLLPQPVRAYDSRVTGGPISGGQTRGVSLASHVPVGAIGVMANLTVTSTNGHGNLRAFAAGAPLPPTSAINWSEGGQTVANAAMINVSAGRALAIFASSGSGATQFIIDITGYLV